MRSEYLMYFCSHCLHDHEHVKLTFDKQIVLVCQFCQETTEIKIDKPEETVKRTFTVASVLEENRNAQNRHWVIAEIQCKEKSGIIGDNSSKLSTIMVRYPSYGPESHYTSLLSTHPEGKNLPHKDSEIIAKKLKLFMGIK